MAHGTTAWAAVIQRPASFDSTATLLPSASRRGPGFVYVHIQPQHQCILTEQGGWAVDYIGRWALLCGRPFRSLASQQCNPRGVWSAENLHSVCLFSPATQPWRPGC